MKKYILLLILFVTSLNYNWYYGAVILYSEPTAGTVTKVTPGFQFILEAEGRNEEDRDRNLEKLYTDFSAGSENDFTSIKYVHAFARLWIVILVFCLLHLCYRLVMKYK